ncbi:hypothetical protein MalM25_04500 [Planctomycetes bacterium MalM25]|nr:hypothetical protein MalM25_04500 [Planctomycetes bacterium MalM25]
MVSRPLLLLALFGFFLPSAIAQTDYAALADAAKAEFTPLGDDELTAARARLGQRVVAAERLLRPGTEQGAAWLEYLGWEGVQNQLAPGSKPDLPAARRVLRRLGSGAEGLERAELQAVASSLEEYLRVAQFAPADEKRQRRSFDLAVDGLADLLSEDARLRSARGSYEAERRLALLAGLETTGRGAELAERVRESCGLPNLHLDARESLLNRMVARPVNESTTISDTILGTRIRGTGYTTGMLSLSTLPSAGSARLSFQLSGNTHSDTTGRNGPVCISSSGETCFNASKVVELSDRSFRLMPATASATTRSRTRGVSKVGGGLGSRLIEKIARKRIAQKKSQADAIAGSKAEARVSQRLNEQLNEQILDARRRYDDRLTKPLRRRLATPRSLVQRTTSNALVVEAVQANAGQLAAWDAPPAAADAPLSARLHQTAINNLLDAYLGGVTIRRDSVEEPARLDVVTPKWLKLKAEPPAEGEKFQPWSIRLRGDRPVSVEFGEGTVTALIHTAKIQVEDKSYDRWDLIATYRPEKADGVWRLVRVGPIEVLPTRFDPDSGKKLASSEVGMRNNLAKALNDPPRLPDTVKIDPIDLSDREGPIDGLKMNALRMEKGWFTAGWEAF